MASIDQLPQVATVTDTDNLILQQNGVTYKVQVSQFSPRTGPQGPQGPAGSQGQPGQQGPTGAQGPQGLPGQNGIQGPKGDTGAVGPQGPAGVAGPQGQKGDRGDPGVPGAIGPQGPQGNPGPQGATGAQGQKGDKGDTGSTGATGPQGNVGPQGPQGLPGPKGDQGVAGPQGPQGNVGPQGPQGNVGPQGLQGVPGPQGPQGNTGATGAGADWIAQQGQAGYIANIPQIGTKRRFVTSVQAGPSPFQAITGDLIFKGAVQVDTTDPTNSTLIFTGGGGGGGDYTFSAVNANNIDVLDESTTTNPSTGLTSVVYTFQGLTAGGSGAPAGGKFSQINLEGGLGGTVNNGIMTMTAGGSTIRGNGFPSTYSFDSLNVGTGLIGAGSGTAPNRLATLSVNMSATNNSSPIVGAFSSVNLGQNLTGSITNGVLTINASGGGGGGTFNSSTPVWTGGTATKQAFNNATGNQQGTPNTQGVTISLVANIDDGQVSAATVYFNEVASVNTYATTGTFPNYTLIVPVGDIPAAAQSDATVNIRVQGTYGGATVNIPSGMLFNTQPIPAGTISRPLISVTPPAAQPFWITPQFAQATSVVSVTPGTVSNVQQRLNASAFVSGASVTFNFVADGSNNTTNATGFTNGSLGAPINIPFNITSTPFSSTQTYYTPVCHKVGTATGTNPWATTNPVDGEFITSNAAPFTLVVTASTSNSAPLVAAIPASITATPQFVASNGGLPSTLVAGVDYSSIVANIGSTSYNIYFFYTLTAVPGLTTTLRATW